MGTETVAIDSSPVVASSVDDDSEHTTRNEKAVVGEVVSITDSQVAFDDDNAIIRSGADAAKHLLSLRDDGQPSFTFRSVFLASCLSVFQAVMTQIYEVRTQTISLCWKLVLLILPTVQAYIGRYSRYIHCSHGILPRQRLGYGFPSRRPTPGEMDGQRRPREAASMDQSVDVPQSSRMDS
jgi:hypothetical protein